jgi:stage II sporulation protein D
MRGRDAQRYRVDRASSRRRRTLRVALLLTALFGCATARASGPPEVRVLVYEGAGPIEAGPVEAPRTIHLAAPGALEIEGRGRSGSWSPAGSGPWRVADRRLRGRIVVRSEDDRIQIVNHVGLEDYVASTVGGEMSAGWPREALRAQAVATRTYLLHQASEAPDRLWQVRATTSSQVYRGIEAETPETRAAARETRGEVLTHDGDPILAVFHSTAGGRTAGAGEVWGEDRPYLRTLEVEDEVDAPHTYWRSEHEPAELEEILEAAGIGVGRLETLEVVERTPSGRVARLRVSGSAGRVVLSGRETRALIGPLQLRSTLFEIRRTEQGFAFVGSGYGHGVGMSQWGARALAEKGLSHPRILATFYPGARLERWEAHRLARRLRAPTGSLASIRLDATRLDGSAGSQGDER